MHRFPVLTLLLTMFSCAVSAVEFDDATLYSRLVIDACLGNFSANTTEAGFNTYDATGQLLKEATHKKTKIDYVPGLVAKAVIEAVDFYQDSAFAQPWYYSVEWYGNRFYTTVETTGGSLDNLNAVKLYFKLGELAASGKFQSAQTATVANCATARERALLGLRAHNSQYSISASHDSYPVANAAALPLSAGTTCDVTGGWWHKKEYQNQLWLDGQYMGPALLAQYVAAGQNITGTTDSDWDLITKQFDIVWNYCWNPSDRLLYHAFCADGGTNSSSRSTDWEGLSAETGSEVFHSAEYWGRAEGWYVLALVDVLEQMLVAGLPTSDPRYTRLLGYLQQSVAGLLARQDPATGCWYQLLGHDGTFSVNGYPAASKTGTQTNYLESSATAIFTAVLLKGMRLGFLSADECEAAAKKAYRGLVETFLQPDVDGNPYGLVGCCKSAGLGGSGKTGDNTRDGSAAYYLLGSDTGVADTYTEGKVLGAFILAAVEYERAYTLPLLQADQPEPDCRCLKLTLR